MNYTKLNLGSYLNPRAGYLNADILRWDGVDQIVDLNRLPWPWKNGQFEEVIALDIIEHLGKLTKLEILDELARITTKGGKVVVRVPCVTHYNALASLQHAHAFFINSFEEGYTQPYFRVKRRTLGFTDGGRQYYYGGPLARVWDFLLCHTRLVWTITFELEKK